MRSEQDSHTKRSRGCYLHDASEQNKLGARNAHDESICTINSTGYRSDNSQGCFHVGEGDAGWVDVDRLDQVAIDDQCVDGDAPSMLEAAGGYDPRESDMRKQAFGL